MPNLKSHTDEELITMLKDGAVSAFDEIYNRYWEALLAKAFDRVKSRQDAQEIVQELFIKIWKRSARIELQYTFKTYIYAALRYEIYHFIGKQQIRKNDISLESSEYFELWAQDEEFYSLEIRELQDQIDLIVNNLPEKCKLIFKMSRNEGLSAKNIAYQLHLSPRTVDTQIGKALRILKIALKGRDVHLILTLFQFIFINN